MDAGQFTRHIGHSVQFMSKRGQQTGLYPTHVGDHRTQRTVQPPAKRASNHRRRGHQRPAKRSSTTGEEAIAHQSKRRPRRTNDVPRPPRGYSADIAATASRSDEAILVSCINRPPPNRPPPNQPPPRIPIPAMGTASSHASSSDHDHPLRGGAEQCIGYLGPPGTFTEQAIFTQSDLAGMRHRPDARHRQGAACR